MARLEWSKLRHSQRQVDDVASILRVRGETLDRPYIEKWTNELALENEWSNARAAVGM